MIRYLLFIFCFVGCRFKTHEPKLVVTNATVGGYAMEEVKDSNTIKRIEGLIDSCENSPGKCASKNQGLTFLGSGMCIKEPDGRVRDSTWTNNNDSTRHFIYGFKRVPQKGLAVMRNDYSSRTEWWTETAVFMDGYMIHMYRDNGWHYDSEHIGNDVDSFTDYKFLKQLISKQ